MVNNMAKAKLLLKNDVGLILNITESPLGCTVYDLEGNEISGGGGGNLQLCDLTIVNETGEELTLDIPYITDSGLFSTSVDLPAASTVPVKALFSDNGNNICFMFYNAEDYQQDLTDNVNCTIDPRGNKIIQTAPGPSSATLTLRQR